MSYLLFFTRSCISLIAFILPKSVGTLVHERGYILHPIAVLDEKYLFSGDTLLPIPTVTRFRGGSTKRFWEEDMPRLREMRNIETVFPGHGMRGKLGEMVGVNEAARKYRGYNASNMLR